MKYLAILLAVFALNVHAGQLIAQDGADWVLVTDDVCTNKDVIKHIPMEPEGWRAARALIGGRMFEACWEVMGGGAGAHVIYEDGEQGVIPATAFHEPKGA